MPTRHPDTAPPISMRPDPPPAPPAPPAPTGEPMPNLDVIAALPGAIEKLGDRIGHLAANVGKNATELTGRINGIVETNEAQEGRINAGESRIRDLEADRRLGLPDMGAQKRLDRVEKSLSLGLSRDHDRLVAIDTVRDTIANHIAAVVVIKAELASVQKAQDALDGLTDIHDDHLKDFERFLRSPAGLRDRIVSLEKLRGIAPDFAAEFVTVNDRIAAIEDTIRRELTDATATLDITDRIAAIEEAIAGLNASVSDKLNSKDIVGHREHLARLENRVAALDDDVNSIDDDTETRIKALEDLAKNEAGTTRLDDLTVAINLLTHDFANVRELAVATNAKLSNAEAARPNLEDLMDVSKKLADRIRTLEAGPGIGL